MSPFVEFPDLDRVTLGGAWRGAMLPSAEGLLSGRDPEEVCAVFVPRLQTSSGRNRDPAGATKSKQKTECRRAHDKPRSRDRDKGGIQNGRHMPEQSFHLRPGQRSSPPLQLDSLWPSCSSSYRVKSAVRHLRCVRKGSRSSASSCARSGEVQQPDWQQDWTSHRLGKVDSLAERLGRTEADEDEDMDGN